MTIRFVLLVNRQGQTRLAQYYEYLSIEERRALEGEIVRKCLARPEQQCSFVEHRNYKVIYRRYASLFFLVGVDGDENELAILEFIHCVVETLDRYFGNVCELDIMFHLEKAHFMLEEMVMNGCIVEINKQNILTPIQLMDKSSFIRPERGKLLGNQDVSLARMHTVFHLWLLYSERYAVRNLFPEVLNSCITVFLRSISRAYLIPLEEQMLVDRHSLKAGQCIRLRAMRSV